jgi:CheY-like chemotaxis protein
MPRNCSILHVEDSPEDVFLLQYAFQIAEIANPVHVVSDGQQAIDYLSGTGKFADRIHFPLPGLVLLDLKLPHKMGLDVLRWIRRQPEFKALIVIILTASINEGDLQRAYELGANAFLVKPSSAADLADISRALKHFWLIHNTPALQTPSPGHALASAQPDEHG